MRNTLRLALRTTIVLAIAASGAANFVLYRRAADTYAELQRVRLDPTSAEVFDKANAALGPTPPGQKRIIFFGDSRVAMWSRLPDSTGSQRINRGIGSQTTAELCLRLNRDVLSLRPDVVVLEMGVNDLKTIGVFPDREQEIINSCNRNTDSILGRLREHRIHAVVLTIFPVGNVPLSRRTVWSDKTLVAIAAFNDRLRKLNDAGTTVVDCDAVFVAEGRMRRDYALDTLHINESGYEALNKTVAPVLDRVLANLPARNP